LKVRLTAKGRGAVLWRNSVWRNSDPDERDIMTYVALNDSEFSEGSDFPSLKNVDVMEMCYDLKLVNCEDLIQRLIARKILKVVGG